MVRWVLLAQDIVDSKKFGYGSKLTLSVSWRCSLSRSGAPNEVSAPVSRSHFRNNITSVGISEARSEQCSGRPEEDLGAYMRARRMHASRLTMDRVTCSTHYGCPKLSVLPLYLP